MKEKIITLTGIKLYREVDEFGLCSFFVNDRAVMYWTYERSDDEFYTEKIVIEDFLTAIPFK